MRKNKMLFLLGFFYFLLLPLSNILADDSIVELIFSHKVHVIENEVECISCHEAVESSASGKDNLMPAMETCGGCHDIDSEENCKMCHSDTENPRAVPRIEIYSQLFSHQKHISNGLDCNMCHQDIPEKKIVQPYELPKMASCMDCHSKLKVSNECLVCHTLEEELKPRSHLLNFLHIHGNLAQLPQKNVKTGDNCQLCHAKNYCQECHEGDNLDRMSHPLNYAFTHSLDARGKEQECVTCHTERSFCSDCHLENLVMPQNHTVGWAVPMAGGMHVQEAQNDLENCLSCHEQNAELTCQKSGCHSK